MIYDKILVLKTLYTFRQNFFINKEKKSWTKQAFLITVKLSEQIKWRKKVKFKSKASVLF